MWSSSTCSTIHYHVPSIFDNDEVLIPCQAVITAATLCESVRKDMVELPAMTKSDRSPVTIADYGSQAIICKTLSQTFPKDSVVAEEDAQDLRLFKNKAQRRKITNYVQSALGDDESSKIHEEDVLKWIDHGNGNPSVDRRFWTLDPIDGTKGYLRGDQYAICLALIEGGEVKIGIVACPALDLDGTVGHLFVAEKGKGAWRKTLKDDNLPLKRIHVNPNVESLIQSFEASHGNHASQQAVAKAIGIDTVMLMDSQAKYSMVASGEAALYLRLSSYAENIWDHAAGVILVEEAGGKVTDRNGKALRFTTARMIENSGVVVTNGALHDKVLSALHDQ